jgi:hypothetical protein
MSVCPFFANAHHTRQVKNTVVKHDRLTTVFKDCVFGCCCGVLPDLHTCIFLPDDPVFSVVHANLWP